MGSYKKLDENEINALVEILLKLKIEKNKYENSSKLYTNEHTQKESILDLEQLKKAMELKGFRFESDFFCDLEKISQPSHELSKEKPSHNIPKEKNKTKNQDLSI